MRSRLSSFFLFCSLALAASSAHAQETLSEYARNCDKQVGGTVPAFNCLEGALVPIENKQGNSCSNPSNLINSCNEFNRIGKLESGNPDVEIRFMCRHYNAVGDQSNTTYEDIAVIQHNNSTGATCFYQSPAGSPMDGSYVPAPRSGDTKIFQHSMVSSGGCAKCHDNRGFIRTANLRGVPSPHRIPDPPKETFNYRFPGEGTKNWRVYKVKALNNPTCSGCHSMGTYSENGNFPHSGSSGSLGLQAARTTQSNLLPGTPAWMGFDYSSAEAHYECALNWNAPGCQVTQFDAPEWDDRSEETRVTQLSWVSFTSNLQVRAGEELGRIVNQATGGDGNIVYSIGHPYDECSWDWPRPENGQMILSGRAPSSGRFTIGGKELQPGENRCNIRLVAESAGQRAEYDISVLINNGQSTIYPYDGQVLSLRSKYSGRCLDLRGFNTSNGADIQQYECNGSDAQKFRFQADGKGAFALVNIHANKCVSVKDFTQDNEGRVHSWDCYGNSDQKYRLQPSSSFPGSYSFVFEHSGKCLDVSGPSYDNGALVHQWACLGLANQAFELLP
ncbi:MAG: hypothetical protein EOP10_16435 [Proteobacteria bacterium]|nr:MAG: hypothetical protein EOP10_16435 [Pseudomonadota bacterium]